MFQWIIIDDSKGKVPIFEKQDIKDKNLKELAEKKLIHCGHQTSTIPIPARIFEIENVNENDEIQFPEPVPEFTKGDWVAILFPIEKKIILGPTYWEYGSYWSGSKTKLRMKQQIIGFIPTFGISEKYLKDKQMIQQSFLRENKSTTGEEHEVYLEKLTKQCFQFFENFGIINDKIIIEQLKTLWQNNFDQQYIKEQRFKLISKKLDNLLKRKSSN